MNWYSKYDVIQSKPKRNPATGDYIIYGPIWIKPGNDENLTSKIDLVTEYKVKKNGGINENTKLKAKVSLIVTRCDSSGNVLSGSDAFTVTKDTTDSNGQEFEITSMYTVARQTLKLDFEKSLQYKLEYKIILRSSSDLGDTLSRFDIDFSVDNIKLRATQENNLKWGILGTEDDYHDNVVESD